MEFDPALSEVPVRIGDKHYVLCEASEGASVAYRNAVMRAAKFDVNGKPTSADGLADAEPILVQGCLFEVQERKGERHLGAVSMGFVRALPARVVRQLFQKAQEISDLGPKEDSDPKASTETGGDTSS